MRGSSRGRPGTRGWRPVPAAPSSLRIAGEGDCPAPLAWSDFRVVIPNFLPLRVRFPSWFQGPHGIGGARASAGAGGILLPHPELTGLRIPSNEVVPCPRTPGILGFMGYPQTKPSQIQGLPWNEESDAEFGEERCPITGCSPTVSQTLGSLDISRGGPLSEATWDWSQGPFCTLLKGGVTSFNNGETA